MDDDAASVETACGSACVCLVADDAAAAAARAANGGKEYSHRAAMSLSIHVLQ